MVDDFINGKKSLILDNNKNFINTTT